MLAWIENIIVEMIFEPQRVEKSAWEEIWKNVSMESANSQEFGYF